MLTLTSHQSASHCDGRSRRDFLRVGSLGLAGLSLPWLLARMAQGRPASGPGDYLRDKSVVHVLFTEIAPQMAERPGGYTRITKIGNRKGDNAPMAVIELVREPYQPSAKKSSGKKAAAQPAAQPAEETTAEEVTAEEVPAEFLDRLNEAIRRERGAAGA